MKYLVFGATFRQEFLRRFCDYTYDEETKTDMYFVKMIPSKEIFPEAIISNMSTDSEVPSFLLERGYTSCDYNL